MGLDMYLTAKRYVGLAEGDDKISKAIQAKFPELKGRKGNWDSNIVKGVEIEAGYWRKANAIHDWFVKNVQDGEDECRAHYVSREHLRELAGVCRQVLDDHALAPQLLPTTSGFFFGSTDYDEYYYQDLEQTISIVESCLALPERWDFEYCSSW
jgi:hypothetical protein